MNPDGSGQTQILEARVRPLIYFELADLVAGWNQDYKGNLSRRDYRIAHRKDVYD